MHSTKEPTPQKRNYIYTYHTLISFLKVVSSNSKEHWSGFTSHFTLTNMKGTFSTTISNAVKSIQFIPLPLIPDGDANLLDASNLPPMLNGSILNSDISDNTSESLLQFPTPTIPTALDRHELRKRYVDQHTVPYGEQTGLTKYAPMPKRAGTTIATRSPTPQYPPFPFSIATTYLGAPTVQYTDTAYQTWTTHSIENTVCRVWCPRYWKTSLIYVGCPCCSAHAGQENAAMARALEGLIAGFMYHLLLLGSIEDSMIERKC